MISDEKTFVNQGDLPVFDNPKDGLAFLDEQEQKAMMELHEEARRQMAAASEDPRQQNYFMRLDRKTVVKDDKEYQACLKNGVQMRVIPYGYALQLLKEEDARARQRVKARKKKKAVKQARKKNRK